VRLCGRAAAGWRRGALHTLAGTLCAAGAAAGRPRAAVSGARAEVAPRRLKGGQKEPRRVDRGGPAGHGDGFSAPVRAPPVPGRSTYRLRLRLGVYAPLVALLSGSDSLIGPYVGAG